MRAYGFLVGISLAALSFAFGCQSLADIEERALDTAGGGTDSAKCALYCDTVMTNCTDELTVYKSREVCLAVCAALDPGDDDEPNGNTVACRMFEAKEAARPGEADSHCFRAGPGGGDLCGTDCEAWCGLLEQACPADFSAIEGDCVARCAGLRDEADFNVDKYYATDTLECRLIHVGAALRDSIHCNHAAFNPRATCLAPSDEVPTCADTCKLTMTSCTGKLTVYESEEQCLSACEVFPLGTAADSTGNTVACRKYHAGSAATDAAAHCKHAGPTGDGHCGSYEVDEDKTGNCESYCLLLEAACSEDPDYDFTSRTDCEDTCETDFADKGAAAESRYSVETAAEGGDNIQCRTLFAVRALDDDAECAAALGAAPCN